MDRVSIQPVRDLEAAYPSSPAAAYWLSDLAWHKRMYQETQFRWAAGDVVDIITWHTSGQTEFTSVADLAELQRHQYSVLDECGRASSALADRLIILKEEHGDWEQILAELGLSRLEADTWIWFAQAEAEADRDSANVRRVLKFVPFRNPLIEAWELKQLVRLFEAASAMLEDAICDLLAELDGQRLAAALADASCTHGKNGIRQRIELARTERGGSGDPRRTPVQVF